MFDCLQQHAEGSLSARLDQQQYDESDLISIKTALNLPYYTSSPEFERAYGSVSVNGMEYRYVKRRVYHDTLELLCLPDVAKMQITAARNEFSRIVIDGAVTAPVKKQVTIIKVPLPDFFQQFSWALMPGVEPVARAHPGYRNRIFPEDHAFRPEHPPCSYWS